MKFSPPIYQKANFQKFSPPIIKNKIARHILTGLAVGVAVPIFLTSPYGLYFLVRGAAKFYFRKADLEREIKRLKKQGYVALTKTPQGWLVRLLEKGKKRAAAAQIKELKLPIKSVWDKKWRLFAFDIPEDDKIRRDLLRRKLKDLGMYNFQRSTFVYPYDCREELSLVSDYYNVDRYVIYAEIVNIDIDRELRKHFQGLGGGSFGS